MRVRTAQEHSHIGHHNRGFTAVMVDGVSSYIVMELRDLEIPHWSLTFFVHPYYTQTTRRCPCPSAHA